MTIGIEALAARTVETIRSVEPTQLPVDMMERDAKERPNNIELPDNRGGGIIEKPDMAFIERTSRPALMEQNSVVGIEKGANEKMDFQDSEGMEKNGLTDEEKATIKKETGWSDEIIDYIKDMKQYEILKNADLKEVEINGRKCLVKENIDLDYADADGVTNRERIARGLAPIDSKSGKPIELHHLGQKKDSPLVELTEEEHRTGDAGDGKKNQGIWHDHNVDTEIHGEGNTWNEERKAHWKSRSEQL